MYKELEERMKRIQNLDSEEKDQLKKQIDDAENKKEVTEKENKIYEMRLKYLQKHTENLAK